MAKGLFKGKLTIKYKEADGSISSTPPKCIRVVATDPKSRTFTDHKGRFYVYDEEGDHTVKFSVSGVDIWKGPVTIPDERDVLIDLEQTTGPVHAVLRKIVDGNYDPGAPGCVYGVVTNSSAGGAPICGVRVWLDNAGGLVAETYTDSLGQYVLCAPQGTYSIHASASGYLPNPWNGSVGLNPTNPKTKNISLHT